MAGRTAFIHVDIDDLWSIGECYGVGVPHEQAGLVYRDALPRFRALFAETGVRATFFAVGRDVQNADKAIGVGKSVFKAGKAALKAAEELTPEQEYYLGRAVAASSSRVLVTGGPSRADFKCFAAMVEAARGAGAAGTTSARTLIPRSSSGTCCTSTCARRGTSACWKSGGPSSMTTSRPPCASMRAGCWSTTARPRTWASMAW